MTEELCHDEWIQTVTGGKFYPLCPLKMHVNIEDIAHALSMICRFVGHCREFYSVAQHSVLVSFLGPHSRQGLWYLLHDAPEAYIGDISRPLKRTLLIRDENITVGAAEQRIMRVVANALNLPDNPDWDGIKNADNKLLATEARDLMDPIHPEWDFKCPPIPLNEWSKIVPLSQKEAKKEFLKRYEELQCSE